MNETVSIIYCFFMRFWHTGRAGTSEALIAWREREREKGVQTCKGQWNSTLT
jgi:hypothetical protein